MFEGLGLIREVEIETKYSRRQKQYYGIKRDRFLRGPIPWDQIAMAAKLPGKALAVLLAVHHRLAMTKEPTVSLPSHLMDGLGVGKNAKARSLAALEAAGLIVVERVQGHTARVRLC